MDVSEKVLAAFQIEHKELLEGVRAYLASALQGNPADRRKLDEAFRMAHSLKGGARVCNLGEIETLGHHLESLLVRIREGVRTLDQAALDAMNAAVDAVEDSMSGAAGTISNDAVRKVKNATTQLAELCLSDGTEKPALPREESPEPAVPVVASEEPAIMTNTVQPGRQTLRVGVQSFDRILGLADDLLLVCGPQPLLDLELQSVSERLREWNDEWHTIRRVAGPVLRRLESAPEFSRLVGFFDNSAQHIQRLYRQMAKARLLYSRTRSVIRNVCEQLQLEVREARMVSAESVFQGFRRMIRDLAGAEGKDIDFQTQGLDILADRMVLERLKDPVMHVLRNAVVHGIEDPAHRVSKHKERKGHIALDVRAEGNRLNVVIRDDGRGIDYEIVAQLARQRGWLGQSGEKTPSRRELEHLLFRAGFSTRTRPDQLAGRGMGLSVADEVATRLQGSVRFLASNITGTAVEFDVPLAVSLHRLLAVACDEVVVGIPMLCVERVLMIRSKDIRNIEGKPAIIHDDRPLRLCGIKMLMGAKSQGQCIARDRLHLVILRTPSGRTAMIVDRFLGEHKAVIKDLNGPAGSIKSLLGGFQLDNGEIGLVLNPSALAEDAGDCPTLITAPGTVEPVEVAPLPTILIVDDSFTTRTLEKSIFETHGFCVKVAVDGLDALKQMRSNHFDVVISDVQMPRMDGFQLLETMKADPPLSNIPVILVTSMDRNEFRERGLNLGADAYIVKQKFNHEELLASIGQFVRKTQVGRASPVAAEVRS